MKSLRAITISQPNASLISLGIKGFETRKWKTSYRGLLLIHAGQKRIDESGKRLWANVDSTNTEEIGHYKDLPYGKLLAIAELTGCYMIVKEKYYDDNLDCWQQTIPLDNQIIAEQQTQIERCCGAWKPNWFAWELKNICRLDPIPAKGKQKLWIPELELREQVAIDFPDLHKLLGV